MGEERFELSLLSPEGLISEQIQGHDLLYHGKHALEKLNTAIGELRTKTTSYYPYLKIMNGWIKNRCIRMEHSELILGRAAQDLLSHYPTSLENTL